MKHESQKIADEKLEKLLLEGLNSGEALPVNDKFWRDLRAEAESILKRHRH